MKYLFQSLMTFPIFPLSYLVMYQRMQLHLHTYPGKINRHSLLSWTIKQIDLSYYDLFGSLKLVLVNGHKIPLKQEVTFNTILRLFTSFLKNDSLFIVILDLGLKGGCR